MPGYYKGYNLISASGNAVGTGVTAQANSQAAGTLYYWNDGGESALLELLHKAPDPAAPYIVNRVITALTLASGESNIIAPMGGIYATRATIYSGGGLTGRVTTFLELYT